MAIHTRTPASLGRMVMSRWKAPLLAMLLLGFVWMGIHSNKPQILDGLGLPHYDQPPARVSGKKLHPQDASALNVAVGGARDRTLVLYAYAESDNARDNFKFFLARALHPRADFIFIFQGETDAASLVPVHLENVRVVQRENTCYDMGAFGEVLARDGLWMRYKGFITLNASVRGPFLPMWSDDCWTDAFLNRVTDKVKLVGLSYSCLPFPHVQSMLLATDQEGMRILLDPELAFSVPLDTPPWGGPELPTGFSQCYDRYANAVHAEIGMARLIRSQGYTVDVMLTSVHSSNADLYCNADRAGPAQDHMRPGTYFGANVHPYEVIFAKANRGIDDNLLNLFTDWHYQMNETSWDKCSRRRSS